MFRYSVFVFSVAVTLVCFATVAQADTELLINTTVDGGATPVGWTINKDSDGNYNGYFETAGENGRPTSGDFVGG